MTDEVNITEKDSVKIADDVIAVAAARAAAGTSGVYELDGGFLHDSISENILRKPSETKGIKVSQDDGRVTADIYVIMEYGVKIPSVSWNIQENVKKDVESITGLQVSAVNIHVQGIHFTEDV